MVFTTPLTALHFGYIPALAVLSNIAGLWAVSLCFGLGWTACALSLLPWLGYAAAWLCSWPVSYTHLGTVKSGCVKLGDEVAVSYDRQRREAIGLSLIHI